MTLKRYSYKQEVKGLPWAPAAVSTTVTSAANTVTISAAFTNQHGEALSERAFFKVFLSTAYTSYESVNTGSSTNAGGTNFLGQNIAAGTSAQTYEFLTCADGTATVVFSSAGTQNLFVKFVTAQGRVLDGATAAITFS